MAKLTGKEGKEELRYLQTGQGNRYQWWQLNLYLDILEHRLKFIIIIAKVTASIFHAFRKSDLVAPPAHS